MSPVDDGSLIPNTLLKQRFDHKMTKKSKINDNMSSHSNKFKMGEDKSEYYIYIRFKDLSLAFIHTKNV